MKFYQNVQQMIRRIALLLVLAFVGATEGLHAQRFAVSANLPALPTGTISVEPSVALGDRTSLQLSFSARPGLFKLPMPVGLINTLYGHLGNVGFSERLKWGSVEHAEMAAFSPALRYWTKGVYNRGFFVSGHALGMVYRFGGGSLSRTYSEGFLVGAGGSIGYSYELAPHWNLEAEVGLVEELPIVDLGEEEQRAVQAHGTAERLLRFDHLGELGFGERGRTVGQEFEAA